MDELITLCGDNCMECPRYKAHSEEELRKAAELWYRIGWRDRILSAGEMRCAGCSSHRKCIYDLVECAKERHVEKCNQCPSFPCEKILDMLERSKRSQKKCMEVCSADEYATLEKAFFHKEDNLRK